MSSCDDDDNRQQQQTGAAKKEAVAAVTTTTTVETPLPPPLAIVVIDQPTKSNRTTVSVTHEQLVAGKKNWRAELRHTLFETWNGRFIVASPDVDGFLSTLLVLKHFPNARCIGIYADCKFLLLFECEDGVKFTADDAKQALWLDCDVAGDCLCVGQHVVRYAHDDVIPHRHPRSFNPNEHFDQCVMNSFSGPHGGGGSGSSSSDDEEEAVQTRPRDKYPFATVHFLLAALDEPAANLPAVGSDGFALLAHADSAVNNALVYRTNSLQWYELMFSPIGEANACAAFFETLLQPRRRHTRRIEEFESPTACSYTTTTTTAVVAAAATRCCYTSSRENFDAHIQMIRRLVEASTYNGKAFITGKTSAARNKKRQHDGNDHDGPCSADKGPLAPARQGPCSADKGSLAEAAAEQKQLPPPQQLPEQPMTEEEWRAKTSGYQSFDVRLQYNSNETSPPETWLPALRAMWTYLQKATGWKSTQPLLPMRVSQTFRSNCVESSNMCDPRAFRFSTPMAVRNGEGNLFQFLSAHRSFSHAFTFKKNVRLTLPLLGAPCLTPEEWHVCKKSNLAAGAVVLNIQRQQNTDSGRPGAEECSSNNFLKGEVHVLPCSL